MKLEITWYQYQRIQMYIDWLCNNPTPCIECNDNQESIICDECECALEWVAKRQEQRDIVIQHIGAEAFSSQPIQKLIEDSVRAFRISKRMHLLMEDLKQVQRSIEDTKSNITINYEDNS